MRGAPFCFPTADAAVFTTGVLPPTDQGQRHLVRGVGPALDRLGMTLAEATGLTRAEVHGVLAGRGLGIDDLGAELATRVADRLPPEQRALWEEQGPYAAGQPLGEGVVHFCLRILTLQRVVCFAPREGNLAPFVLMDEWLGGPVPDLDPEVARAELLRRYLRCYGPSTRASFAAWLGIDAGDVEPWWGPVEDALTEVRFRGTAWILTEDVDALRSAPAPRGVRLLPPRDPYTQLGDRDSILDPAFHREVWRAVGAPGAVLKDGRIAGTWRPRRTGRSLTLTVRAFGAFSDRDRASLRSEAEQVAVLRGASSARVAYDA